MGAEVRAGACGSMSMGPERIRTAMASSRVTRLGASLLLILALTAGLASVALGASPTDPTPGPSIAPKTPPTHPKTSTTPAGCLPSESSSMLIWLSCSHQTGHSTQPNAGGAAPATTGYSIQGTVTGIAATPVAGILVDAFGNNHDYFATTDGSGNYSVDAVPAGTWTVEFVDTTGTYLNGYYDSGAGGNFTITQSSATPLTVTSGNVTGINARLGTGYYIRGTVTGTGGTPLGGIDVHAESSGLAHFALTTTASNGTYSIDVPASDSYYVGFSDPGHTYADGYYGYSNLFYTVAVDSAWATLVAVGTSDVTGISAQMLLPWTVTLGASATTVTAGTSVTLTATANQDVGPTPYYIVILTSGGTVVGSAFCGTGATCATPVTSSVPASATYHAVIGASDGTLPLMMSAPLPVTWTTFSTYHALTPKRLLDTRDGTGGLSGPFSSHVARTFQLTGGSSGVPSGAIAVTGNLTVTQQTSLGFLAIGPVAMNNPTSSTLNFPVADDRANAVTVALSGTGTLSVTYAAPTLGPTAQVIFDVTGYFTPDTSGATYHALTPARILDTRDGTGGLGVFSSHVAQTFGVWGRGGVPSSAIAVTGNLTVTGQTSLGYLSVGPVAQNNPTSSTLNFPVNDDRANAV